MLDEDVIIKTAKNGNERLLFANVLVVVGATAFMLGGTTDISAGIFLGLGIIAPINVLAYKRTWLDADPNILIKYFLCLLPYLVSLIIAMIGIFNPVVVEKFVGDTLYYKMAESASTFVSGSIGNADPVLTELSTIACVACALSIYFLTDSRYTIRRILSYCCAFAGVLACFGIFYFSLSSFSTFAYLPNLGTDSFSTFASSQHWSAFALLWLGTSLGISIYTSQRFRLDFFIKSLRFAMLVCAAVLLASIMLVGTPIEKTAAMGISSIAMLMLFIDTIPTKSNIRRHWAGRHGKIPQHKFLGGIVPCTCYLLAGLSFAYIAVISAFVSYNNPAERLIVNSKNENTISLSEKLAVLDDIQPLIIERPIFGWGTASFRDVFAFKQGSDLGVESWITPSSDFLRKIVENGYVGIVLSAITPLFFFLLWLVRRSFSATGIILLLTCLSTLAIGFVESPFSCISVELGFWIIMMSAFRWDNAEIK